MKLKLFAASLILVLSVGWAAQSQSGRMKRLPGNGWTLVARDSGQALLVPKPRNQGPKGSRKAGAPVQALLIAPGTDPSLIPARSRGLFASGLDSQPRVWSTQLGGRKVLFNPVGDGPAMGGVPGRSGDYVFSANGTVWVSQPGGAPRKLAADSVTGFSREELAAGPGLEEGGLIWAANPMVSPDGRFVTYVTNREAFREQSAGQSVWMVDYESGHEQELLASSEESFTPLGWMGEELLFTGDQGGVSALHPESLQVHSMGMGTLLALDSSAGVAAMLEGNLPSNRRLVLMKQGTRLPVARRTRWEYAGSADFSPDGSRLAVVLSAADGSKQVQVVDVSTGQFQLLPLPSPRREILVDPPRWVDDQTLLVTTSLRSGEERSSLLPVPVSNAQ